MAKFMGVIGYGHSVETAPGVWQDVITEVEAYGDVIQTTRRLEFGEQVNPELTVTNTISIVADAYASENYFAIRYVSWMGALWIVNSVEVQSPRLLLRMGEVYHGPTP